MLKIRRSHLCLIFNMGMPIPGRDRLYIETGPEDFASLSQLSTVFLTQYVVCLLDTLNKHAGPVSVFENTPYRTISWSLAGLMPKFSRITTLSYRIG